MASEGKFASIAEIEMGQSPSGDSCSELPIGLPLLNGPTEFGIYHPTPVQFTSDPRKIAARKDILFCVRGSTTGRMNWADQSYAIGRGIAAIRGKHGYPNSFVRAVLEAGLPALLAQATGSTFPNVSRSMLADLPIRPVAIEQAKEIGAVAEYFAERIHLLREASLTLETIAQTLFKSWFVDFDPVRAKAEGREPEGMDPATAALFPSEFEDSELGSIPKGWRAGLLREVCRCHDSKRIPLSGVVREKRQGFYPYYGAASVLDHIDDYIFDGVFVLLAEDGTVATKSGFAMTQYIWGKTWVNNHAHVLEGLGAYSTEQLLLHLQRVRIGEFVTGAVQAKVSQKNMFRIPVVIATEAILRAFSDSVSVLFGAIRSNTERAQTLARFRDTLLPRLISGKLRLPEAEREVDAATA